MLKKSVVFIGNRVGCFDILLNSSNYEISNIFILENSFLHKYIKDKSVENVTIFSENNKDTIINTLINLKYDILVSNGCPFILPASKLKEQNKILLNTHPTYLPHLRGATPLNGVFYKNYSFIGATTHYIDDNIDSGNIIYQEKIELSDDIDQGLVYYISFDLERTVFEKSLKILEDNNFNYIGLKMNLSDGCYFNRTEKKQQLDFTKDNIELSLKKIKSFGISTQGCFVTINGEKYRVFEAESITNQYLLDRFKDVLIGDIALVYGDNFIIKLVDGLLKIKKWSKIN